MLKKSILIPLQSIIILLNQFILTTLLLAQKIVLADLFAGTGVVSAFMLSKGMDVIVNDTLLSNYIAYHAWFGEEKFDIKKLNKKIYLDVINGRYSHEKKRV